MEKRRIYLAFLAFLLIHGGILAPFYPHALGLDRLAAIDPDLLGFTRRQALGG